MVRKSVFIVLYFVLLVSAQLAAAQDEAGDLLRRINDLRASRGLAPYSLNGALNAAAQNQAQWIVETGSVSHTRPDGSGPRTRALNAGYGTTDVSENIYGGTQATVDVAWNFWVNSAIHYAGLTHPAYREAGIGIARGSWGAAFVVVFGNPGGPPPLPPAPPGDGGQGNTIAVAAAPALPSYIVGQDANGNIMHQVQPGDTLGDIALIYGYTWDDLPYMMQINGLNDVRDLEVGSIFLVPPQAGTFTPTPGDLAPTPTPAATEPARSAPTATHTARPAEPTATATVLRIATAASVPEMLGVTEAVGTSVAMALPSDSPPGTTPGVIVTRAGTSPWLIVALVVQVIVLVGAGIEFIRRTRRRNRR